MAWEWLGPTATAVVGVAGIVGTVTAAALARRAQVEVARMAPVTATLNEKRALYAKYLRTVEDMVDQVGALAKIRERRELLSATDEETDAPTRQDELNSLGAHLVEANDKLPAAVAELARLRAEVSLLGGQSLGTLVSRLNTALLQSARKALSDGQDDGRYRSLLSEVVDALHDDITTRP